ncbi:MAG TPA: hypothetical protein VL574_12760 [Stellaceae bacterium]|nr:hypothetical protein [Stellaceae bacterium]
MAVGIVTSALAACTGVGQPSSSPQAYAGLAPIRLAGLAPTQIAALDNLSKTEILAKLGQPDFTRRDPPAEIWQYRSVGCVLDLFMYPQGAGDLHVAHAVSRDPASTVSPQDSCTPFPAPKVTAAS